MDPTNGGISVDSVILALFLLALTALGVIIMAFGTGIRNDIRKIFDRMDAHAEEDQKKFTNHSERIIRLEERNGMK